MPRNGYCRNHAQTRVTGPPCAGKTTYVREVASNSDLVVDWDQLLTALSTRTDVTHTHPPELAAYAAEARDAILARLTQHRAGSEPAHAWVIATYSPATLAGVHVEHHTLDLPADECIRRLHTDPDGRDVAATESVIKEWHAGNTR